MKKRSVFVSVLLGAALPLAAAIIIPAIFITFGSKNPSANLGAFFLGPWKNPWFIGNTLDYMTLLLCASLGSALAFRGGCFNLGGEGQIYLGGCASAAVLLAVFPAIPGENSLPLIILPMIFAALAAMASGALMGGFSGFLKKACGASELITSFLLSAALIPLGDQIIAMLRDPANNLLSTAKIVPSRLLPRLLPPSSLSISFILVLLSAVLIHVFMNRTAPGYRFRISGVAPSLAKFGGFNAEKLRTPSMAASGALLGLCGYFSVVGTYGMCYVGFPSGLGWNAIAASLIAGNEALLLIPVSIVFAALKAGSDAALLQAGFGFETAAFIQAAALLLAALPFGSRYFGRRGL